MLKVQQFIDQMISLDTNGLALVIMICALGCVIMHATLPVPIMAFFSYPVLVVCALAARALLADSYMVVSLERGPGIALTTGIGMVVGLTGIVLLVRIWMMIRDVTGKRPELLRPSEEQAP